MKDINRIFDEFVMKQSEQSRRVYQVVISKFKTFLSKNGLNENNVYKTLSNLTCESLLEFLDECFNEPNFETKTLANRYRSIISSFLDYIIDNSIINDELLVQKGKKYGYGSFNELVRNKINSDSRLREPVANRPLEYDDIQIIKTNCLQGFNRITNKYRNQIDCINSRDFSNMCTFIRLYLMCSIGIGPTKMQSLVNDDVDLENKIIKFGKFDVIMTDELRELFIEYMKFRKTINCDSDFIFITFEGKGFKSRNESLNTKIKDFLGYGTSSGITKYYVIKMIRNRISPIEIADITDSKGVNYKHCADLVYDRQEESKYISCILFQE